MAVAWDEKSPPLLHELQPLWHDSAPHRVVSESTEENPLGGWKAWRQHLADRLNPEPPPFLAGEQPPLLWGWPQAWRHDEIRGRLPLDNRQRSEALFDATSPTFLDTASAPDLPSTLQLVALAYALPKLSEFVPAEKWWQSVEQLYNLAGEAQQHRVDWPADAVDVLRQQLLAGELALALSYLFPEVRALRALRESSRSALSEGLIELTDGQGLPHGRLLAVFGPLFACWTRARWLGERLKAGSWSPDADVQYEWLVRHAVRLADADGRFLLSHADDTSGRWTTELFATALAIAGDECDCAAATVAISKKAVPKRLKFKAKNLPNPSMNSDWSGITVAAAGWSQKDVRLAVKYSDDPLQIELSASGRQILAGGCYTQTTCDDARVEVAGEWEQLCFEKGKNYVFLELGIDLSRGLRLERQILLAPRDRMLYFADIVVSPEGQPRRLHHSLQLSIAADIAWRPEVETRDGLLEGRKTRTAILPLSLNEWRSDPRGGSLFADNGRLTLVQEATGKAMCCALAMDLDKNRSKRPRTWRQLTVAEWMEVLPRDVAVAFRAQSGDDQWLFYRSLGPTGNRTFLGQNTAGEFSAGRFDATGKYKEWIEVDPV